MLACVVQLTTQQASLGRGNRELKARKQNLSRARNLAEAAPHCPSKAKEHGSDPPPRSACQSGRLLVPCSRRSVEGATCIGCWQLRFLNNFLCQLQRSHAILPLIFCAPRKAWKLWTGKRSVLRTNSKEEHQPTRAVPRVPKYARAKRKATAKTPQQCNHEGSKDPRILPAISCNKILHQCLFIRKFEDSIRGCVDKRARHSPACSRPLVCFGFRTHTRVKDAWCLKSLW